MEKISNIEELAHIIGQKIDGPRGDEELNISERDEFNNIILLCPNCHTKIDKNPDIYNLEILTNWKQKHEDKIKHIFNVPTFSSRLDLRSTIAKILKENKAIFNQYGPMSEIALVSSQSEASTMWRAKSIEVIIPNNRRISELLERNYGLLVEGEHEIVAKFMIHKEGFEFNKLSEDKNSSVPLFPTELEEILK